MLGSDLVEVMRTVGATDLATCDDAALEAVAAGLHRLRCWLDSTEAAVVARRADLASDAGRRSARDGGVVIERAAICAVMPEVHQALAAGVLSAGHADAIARAANRLDDA